MSAQVGRIITLEEEIKRCPEMKMEYVEAFRDWIKKQPHLPPVDDDLLILSFLRRCKFSMEKAKVKFDNYFTFRTQVPEMCVGRTVDHTDVKEMLKIWQIAILPKTDHNGNIVVFQRAISSDATHFNPNVFLKILLSLLEHTVREKGTIPGYVLVYDQKNVSLSHLAKANFTMGKRYLFFIQKCAPVSVKGVYVLNSNNVTEAAIKFMKSVTQGNMINKIEVFHEGETERINNFLPQSILPEEYGGDAGKIDDLAEQTYNALVQIGSYTVQVDKLKVDERKRKGGKIDFGALFGAEGSFRKLDVD